MATKEINPKLEALLEYGPIVAFFVAYKFLQDHTFTVFGTDYAGFIAVTGGFVVVMLITTYLLIRLTGEASKMQIVTLILVIVFGGLTVWLNDPKFIKVKVTIIYLIFGGLLGFGLLQGKSYLTYALKPKAIASMRLSMEGWMIMTRRLTAFFFALAIVNEVIWRNFSTESWVYFKTFGLTIAIFGFFLAQGALFKTHSVGDET